MPLILNTLADVERALRAMGNGHPNDLTRMADIIAEYISGDRDKDDCSSSREVHDDQARDVG